MNIQNAISILRSAGVKQVEIGREIKRSQATVSELEAGKYGSVRPSADVVAGLKRLARRHKIILPKSKIKQAA